MFYRIARSLLGWVIPDAYADVENELYGDMKK